MTNGEKIKQIFPGLQIDEGELEVYMWTTTHDAIDIPLEWWNAEYKEPKHIADADKMIEPTTKNCRSCRNFGSHHGICEICKDNKCWTEIEPTKNDLGVDCISRDEVCRYVAEFVNHEFSTREEEELIDNIITGIEHMPSVTPQTRKGHWIESMPGGAEEWCYKCSECNFWKYKKTINLSKFKFCPNCGADMRGEE